MRRHRIDLGNVHIGDGDFSVIAGPCAVESREQILTTAASVKAHGASVLRGGAFKPRTSPRSFQGLGWEGVELLAEAGRATGLPTVSEVLDPQDVERMSASVDVLQIGARNMQNFPLLREVGRTRTPVVLKRGLSATLDELLSAVEYITAEGNENVMLCERGVRTFEPSTRNTLDLSAVAVLHERTHLPVIVDPSHAVGVRRWIRPLARAAKAAGADGVMLEVHPNPNEARSDKEQALSFEDFAEIARDLDAIPHGDAPVRRMVGVRGAITVDRDDAASIEHATARLLDAVVTRNAIRTPDIVSAFFSLTRDLHAGFPAATARALGWHAVPMLHFCEIDVDGALPRTLRVLLHVTTSKRAHEIEHVYLDGARVLRPDLDAIA